MEQSIYTDRVETVFDLRGMVARLDNEMRVCESLLTMGYVQSNGVNLEKRIKFLGERIASIEEELKRTSRFGRVG